jgi:hypothetical protein
MLPHQQPSTETTGLTNLCALAHQWGQEDALEGLDLRGSQYFLIGDAAWRAYNDGYDIGIQLRKVQATPEELGALEFMDYVLATLHAGREPLARLTDEQLAEIERERPGDDFTHYPFLY